MKKTVALCGGHLTPALSCIEELRVDCNWRIVYFGRLNALEADTSSSLEYDVLRHMDVVFYSIPVGRFSRFSPIATLATLVKFPYAMIVSLFYLLKEKPGLVVSFGSYVALPVCLGAIVLQIPVLIHEQTHVLGLTNRILARLAYAVCLSWSKTEGVPKGVKTTVTGNLLRKSFFQNKNSQFVTFGNRDLPLLFITGGSLGSHTINTIVERVFPILCKTYRVLHQCGKANSFTDYNRLISIREQQIDSIRDNYLVLPSIDPSEIGEIMRCASLVIGRSGANTVTEILASGTPSILIPLPWAADDEQKKNAFFLQRCGVARVISQNQLEERLLLQEIDVVFQNRGEYIRKFQSIQNDVHHDTTGQFVQLMKRIINEKNIQ